MAKVPTIHARSAGFIVDDLRRRRLAVDRLLKEVGLQKADLSHPDNRLPQTPVFHLMERAASLTADASYGLRLAASLNPRDRGLLGFVVLNSPTLIDAMTNIQRFYKVGREGHDCEIERYGPHVQDLDMRLTQVAYLAGFTEPAALVRAFKRWTGETPSEFRERPRSAL